MGEVPLYTVRGGVRQRANSAHIRQFGTKSGTGSQARQVKTFKLFLIRAAPSFNTVPYSLGTKVLTIRSALVTYSLGSNLVPSK